MKYDRYILEIAIMSKLCFGKYTYLLDRLYDVIRRGSMDHIIKCVVSISYNSQM